MIVMNDAWARETLLKEKAQYSWPPFNQGTLLKGKAQCSWPPCNQGNLSEGEGSVQLTSF